MAKVCFCEECEIDRLKEGSAVAKVCFCGECEIDRLEDYNRAYLRGWTYEAEILSATTVLGGVHAQEDMKNMTIGCIVLCRRGVSSMYDISTPFGAGMADAALSAWGL